MSIQTPSAYVYALITLLLYECISSESQKWEWVPPFQIKNQIILMQVIMAVSTAIISTGHEFTLC